MMLCNMYNKTRCTLGMVLGVNWYHKKRDLTFCPATELTCWNKKQDSFEIKDLGFAFFLLTYIQRNLNKNYHLFFFRLPIKRCGTCCVEHSQTMVGSERTCWTSNFILNVIFLLKCIKLPVEIIQETNSAFVTSRYVPFKSRAGSVKL